MRAILALGALLVLSGCCGRGLWYSSPSRSDWCGLAPAPAATDRLTPSALG